MVLCIVEMFWGPQLCFQSGEILRGTTQMLFSSNSVSITFHYFTTTDKKELPVVKEVNEMTLSHSHNGAEEL